MSRKKRPKLLQVLSLKAGEASIGPPAPLLHLSLHVYVEGWQSVLYMPCLVRATRVEVRRNAATERTWENERAVYLFATTENVLAEKEAQMVMCRLR